MALFQFELAQFFMACWLDTKFLVHVEKKMSTLNLVYCFQKFCSYQNQNLNFLILLLH